MSIGEAVTLVQDSDSRRVFQRGELVYAWSADGVPLRRLVAVQLVVNKAARVGDIAAAFGVDAGTLWRWVNSCQQPGSAVWSRTNADPRAPRG